MVVIEVFTNFATGMKTAVFKIEFNRLYLPLCMYSLRILNNKEEAEDVVQQCFTTVWQLISNGQEIDNLKAYIYRAVRNKSLIRLQQLNSVATVSIDNFADSVSEEEIDTSERDAKLWAAIDRLPDKCREIFLLSKRDGLSHKEIADMMGISVKTIENQMTKAFSRLRESLEPRVGTVFFLPFL